VKQIFLYYYKQMRMYQLKAKQDVSLSMKPFWRRVYILCHAADRPHQQLHN